MNKTEASCTKPHQGYVHKTPEVFWTRFKNIVERLAVPFTRNYLNRTKIQYQSELEGVILKDPRSLFKATASADNTLLDLHNSSDDTQPH